MVPGARNAKQGDDMGVKPGVLIFDVDGTLADTERDGHRVAFNRTFAEAGLDWHWSVEEYGRLLRISGGKERMTAYMRDNPIKDNAINDIKSFMINVKGNMLKMHSKSLCI